jgi:hypothetical protein
VKPWRAIFSNILLQVIRSAQPLMRRGSLNCTAIEALRLPQSWKRNLEAEMPSYDACSRKGRILPHSDTPSTAMPGDALLT